MIVGTPPLGGLLFGWFRVVFRVKRWKDEDPTKRQKLNFSQFWSLTFGEVLFLLPLEIEPIK